MKRESFLPLYVTNFFGTLNDNFLKTFAGFTVIGWIPDEREKSLAMGVTAAALVLPYIFCSPLADRLTVVWRKCAIVRLAKWVELPIMFVAVLGFALRSPWLVVGSVLLMGLQSSLYSPAKYALIRDIGGADRISTGMGGMEGVSFLGVLAGTVAASFVSDLEMMCPGSHVSYWCLGAFAMLGLIASYTVKAKEELNRSLHSVNPLRYIRRVYRMTVRCEGLNPVIMTLSFFWWAAAMLQMGLLVYGKTELGLSATGTGAMLISAAVFLLVPFLFTLHCRKVLESTGRWVLRRRYRVEVEGLEALKDAGKPCLVLPNHPAMVAPMLVMAELDVAQLKLLVDEAFFNAGFPSSRVLKTLGAVPVPNLRKSRSRAGMTAVRGLEDIVKTKLVNGDNVVLYPSGHIWTDPKECIGTRQLAYNLCRTLPVDIEVIGVRTLGLWESIWSRKGRRNSPPFMITLAKSVFLWLFYAPFVPRHRVTMHVENITDRSREWAKGTRIEFNAKLEKWYEGVSARVWLCAFHAYIVI